MTDNEYNITRTLSCTHINGFDIIIVYFLKKNQMVAIARYKCINGIHFALSSDQFRDSDSVDFLSLTGKLWIQASFVRNTTT